MKAMAELLGEIVWIEPSTSLAERLSLPVVPLPVRATTAASLTTERLEPAAIALDVDLWLTAGNGSAAERSVMSRWVTSLCYVAATELLDAGRPATAAKVASVGVRHAPDDPSLRVLLGMARWDTGHRSDGLAQLVLAVEQYAQADQVAPMLSVLTARALSEAGRHDAARSVLEPLVRSEPRTPLFWDLVDTLDRRAGSS